MLFSQSADLSQGFPVPDLTDRIVRVAQYHQRRLRVSQLSFQILKVDLVFLPVILQRIFQHPGSVIDDGIEEYVVYRCLNDDILIRRCQLSDR